MICTLDAGPSRWKLCFDIFEIKLQKCIGFHSALLACPCTQVLLHSGHYSCHSLSWSLGAYGKNYILTFLKLSFQLQKWIFKICTDCLPMSLPWTQVLRHPRSYYCHSGWLPNCLCQTRLLLPKWPWHTINAQRRAKTHHRDEKNRSIILSSSVVSWTFGSLPQRPWLSLI